MPRCAYMYLYLCSLCPQVVARQRSNASDSSDAISNPANTTNIALPKELLRTLLLLLPRKPPSPYAPSATSAPDSSAAALDAAGSRGPPPRPAAAPAYTPVVMAPRCPSLTVQGSTDLPTSPRALCGGARVDGGAGQWGVQGGAGYSQDISVLVQAEVGMTHTHMRAHTHMLQLLIRLYSVVYVCMPLHVYVHV